MPEGKGAREESPGCAPLVPNVQVVALHIGDHHREASGGLTYRQQVAITVAQVAITVAITVAQDASYYTRFASWALHQVVRPHAPLAAVYHPHLRTPSAPTLTPVRQVLCRLCVDGPLYRHAVHHQHQATGGAACGRTERGGITAERGVVGVIMDPYVHPIRQMG